MLKRNTVYHKSFSNIIGKMPKAQLYKKNENEVYQSTYLTTIAVSSFAFCLSTNTGTCSLERGNNDG